MGIPTHIKQQNSNNNIKKITFDMCAPPRFCTQLWALQRYFCLFVILSGLESTTLKPIYWFWASGVSLHIFVGRVDWIMDTLYYRTTHEFLGLESDNNIFLRVCRVCFGDELIKSYKTADADI